MTQSASLDIAAVAASFVDLVFKEGWNETELTSAEVEILFATISAAGFNPKEIVKDGLSYESNRRGCQVIDQSGHVHVAATNWMHKAFFLTLLYKGRHIQPQRLQIAGQSDPRREAIERIRTEIERSIPLEPIRLTSDGDRLREISYDPPPQGFSHPAVEAFPDHVRDEHELVGRVGVHDYCEGLCERIRVAKTVDALVCRNCYLQVLFSREVKTYGDLRKASKWVRRGGFLSA